MGWIGISEGSLEIPGQTSWVVTSSHSSPRDLTKDMPGSKIKDENELKDQASVFSTKFTRPVKSLMMRIS